MTCSSPKSGIFNLKTELGSDKIRIIQETQSRYEYKSSKSGQSPWQTGVYF